nr:transglycosylase domain-containing protein [Priestia koreensis]
MPESVKNAFLATEDARFYKHHGVDFYRLGEALYWQTLKTDLDLKGQVRLPSRL